MYSKHTFDSVFIFPGIRTHDLGDATPSFSEKPVYMLRRITFNQAFRQDL